MMVGIASSVATGLAVFGLTWLALSLLDMGLGIVHVALRIVATAMLICALAVLGYGTFRVLRVSQSIRSYAARVGSQLKEIGLDLLTLLDLAEMDNRKFGYSEALIARAMDGVAERVKHFDLEVGLRRRRLVLASMALGVMFLGGLVWLRLDPASFDYSFARLNYFLGFSRESGIKIDVEPGDLELLAGSDLRVDVGITAFVKRTPDLHAIAAGEERTYRMERTDDREARGHAGFTTTLPKIDRDLTYFVALGDERTRIFRVSVREEPRITGGEITLFYPAYTGLASEMLPQGTWDVAAPYGTEAAFSLGANCKPDSAWISCTGEGGRAWNQQLAAGGDSLGARIRLVENLAYTLELAATGGVRAASHGPHTVKAIPDNPPFVRIESPDRETMLEADMLVPLSVVALDDYGISQMKVYYEFKGGKGEFDLPYRGKAQARCDYTWDVTQLDVFPGDAVSYYVQVADNDALTGPKYSRTDVYVARVPTVYELYENIEERESEDIGNLEEVAEKAKEAKEDLDNIQEEMKKEPEKEGAIDWEKEQALRQSIAGQDDIAKELDKISSSLDETLEMMDQNSLVNFQIIEKMEEIRQLIEEVGSQDLLKAIEQMREAMAQLSPDEIKAAMQNMDMSQEDLLRKLDQAIQMLKHLQAEQKMEAAANLAKQMAEAQKDANQSLRSGDSDKAGRQEKQISDDAEQLREMMRQLADLLKAEKNPVANSVDEAAQYMDQKQLKQAMEQMIAQMQAGQSSSALQQGESLEQDLNNLASMLQSASDQMMNADKQKIMAAMRETVDNLRDVSARQEDVLNALEDKSGQVPRSELARREMVFKETLDRIAEKMFELSQQTLFVDASLGRAILQIGQQAEAAARDLSEGTGKQASGSVRVSLGAINVLMTGLMDAMEKASSCNNPGGLAEAFDGLENMCSMQMGINLGTQQAMQDGQQGLSMEARAQMARLAAQQEMIQQGLEDFGKQYGNRSEILGRLDDLAEEAKRVAEDLKRQNVNEETLARQQRIVTRMLDAQKSLRRREYSQRRKSRPGEMYEMASPPPLSLEEREAAVRDLLYRGRGYYPPEYEELIRAYFKAISAPAGGQ